MKNVNSDIAYEYLRKRILNGEYQPGEALMTNVLSSEIGVSRTPVRDALRQLETDGLVSIQPRLGATVKAMTLKEFRELCGLRLALEAYAAGLAARTRTTADLQEIALALNAMRRLTERLTTASDEAPLLAELIREDIRFHIAIITSARNDLMKKEILRLHVINRVVSGAGRAPKEPAALSKPETTERRQAILKSHEEIYRAIEASDADVARSAMERHIQDIIDNALLIMAPTGAGVVARELTPEELAYTA